MRGRTILVDSILRIGGIHQDNGIHRLTNILFRVHLLRRERRGVRCVNYNKIVFIPTAAPVAVCLVAKKYQLELHFKLIYYCKNVTIKKSIPVYIIKINRILFLI